MTVTSTSAAPALRHDLRRLRELVARRDPRPGRKGFVHSIGNVPDGSGTAFELAALSERITSAGEMLGLVNYFESLSAGGYGPLRLPAATRGEGGDCGIVFLDSMLPAWLAALDRLEEDARALPDVREPAEPVTQEPVPPVNGREVLRGSKPRRANKDTDFIALAISCVSRAWERERVVLLVREVAERIGCHAKYLSSPAAARFKQFRERLVAEAAVYEPRTGRKDGGRIEAED